MLKGHLEQNGEYLEVHFPQIQLTMQCVFQLLRMHLKDADVCFVSERRELGDTVRPHYFDPPCNLFCCCLQVLMIMWPSKYTSSFALVEINDFFRSLSSCVPGII